MTIEDQCRLLCKEAGINPDHNAPEEFQTLPGFPRAPDGKVKNWMTWESTMKLAEHRKLIPDKFEQERIDARANLARIRAEIALGQDIRHQIHTSKY